MSYDISLKDPVTRETLNAREPHMMRGGTYAIGGTTEMWMNITYNYSHYYYDATDGDPRFAHDEISCHYADGTDGPMETQYGIRGIYGKSGAESIPMLKDMIARIEAKYKPNGEWAVTEREQMVCLDETGTPVKDPVARILSGKPYTERKEIVSVNEGATGDYWTATAANAIRPLYSLIAMAQMFPDGVWDGD